MFRIILNRLTDIEEIGDPIISSLNRLFIKAVIFLKKIFLNKALIFKCLNEYMMKINSFTNKVYKQTKDLTRIIPFNPLF